MKITSSNKTFLFLSIVKYKDKTYNQVFIYFIRYELCTQLFIHLLLYMYNCWITLPVFYYFKFNLIYKI